MVDGRAADTKPMRIVMDPAVQLADAQRRRYNELVADLHDLQRRGTEMAATLNALHPQMVAAATKVAETAGVPAAVKTQFEALNRDYNALRVKFGVPLPVPGAGGRGGRGGRGGGGGRGGEPPSVVERTGTVKDQIMGIWEAPSDAMTSRAADVRAELPRAIADANALLVRVRGISPTLQRYGITVTVAAP
jgi:hypothetical protein